MDQDIVFISSDDEHLDVGAGTRRALLEPVVRHVVDALGGQEDGMYRLGDSVAGCLSDLKKLWRKDDTDDERTVARIFWDTRLLPNDLVPILLQTAGKGLVEDKRAIQCADLICAMTWPIDMAEELKELDEKLDKGTDYTSLLHSHLNYKAALLKPQVLQSLFGLILPPLSKPAKSRTERDGQVINVVLHIIRNLAFIKDPPPNMFASTDRAENSRLQGWLIRALEETRLLELLLAIAANVDGDKMFSEWNTIILEIFYLLFRGVKPSSLSQDQSKQNTENLHRLLAAEEKSHREIARKASSRHSRFGTTIAVQLNPKKRLLPSENPTTTPTAEAHQPQPYVLHRQQALTLESSQIMDMRKRTKPRKGNTVDELGREEHLPTQARDVLRALGQEFIRSCFNPFLSGLLKDIKSERPKITEKDNLRLLFVTKWFLEFFISSRANATVRGNDKDLKQDRVQRWGFGSIAEVMERGWIVWVLRRMREAVEEKPKQWTELQAGIECLTQLLLLIDAMSSPQGFMDGSDDETTALKESAETLTQQLIYNGEVLDITFESLRAYKQGTQSLQYLDASVSMGYALLRMLEKWSKKAPGEVYVRRKKERKRRTKGKDGAEDDPHAVPDVEDEGLADQEEEVIHETMFTFETFEMKFAHSEITNTLLAYLSRYKEFESAEPVKRIVSLLHRQAVRAKAEGLFFNASTLSLFKSILDEQKSLPREQPYKDLMNLINFILRKFFKALAEEPFLAVQTFFPKNRGQWKHFSSYEPEEKTKKDKEIAGNTKFPQDVQVKKGYSWSEQLGIAVKALVEDGMVELVNWTKDILTLVIRLRENIIAETDKNEDLDNIDELEVATRIREPSDEALRKFTDYSIPYINDEQADAGTKNPQLKLLFRLVKFYTLENDLDELEWYVPAAVPPRELQGSLNVIDQFLENPIDLDGKKASELLSKKSRRKRRRQAVASDSDASEVEDNDTRKARREKRKKEKEQYKSAQFIEDSDVEYGNMEMFLEKERILRDKAAAAAEESGKIAAMKSTGTKKRRRKAENGNSKKKRRKEAADGDDGEAAQSDTTQSSRSRSASPMQDLPRSRPRPRPRPRLKKDPPVSDPSSTYQDTLDLASIEKDEISSAAEAEADSGESSVPSGSGAAIIQKRKSRLVLSDDEE